MSGFDLPGLGGLDPKIAQSIQDQVAQARADRAQGPREGGDAARVGVPAAPGLGDGRPLAFGSALADAIDRVDGLGREVQDKTQALAVGEPVALHDVMVSMGKSEVAFNLMLEVRNKLVDAWEKLSRSVV